MNKLIAKRLRLLLPILILPSEIFADSWTCHQGALTRNVVIFYPSAPYRLPCRVYYTKPDEDVMPRTLWKAELEENYCQRKASEFVGKLESLGWQCSVSED
jgi:hypothetical protein